jgi:hypothetical protein
MAVCQHACGLTRRKLQACAITPSSRPAEAILDITRKLNDKYAHLTRTSLVPLSGEMADQSKILVSQGRPYVIAQGRLLSHDGQSCVDIKRILFLGLPWGALDALYEVTISAA